MKYLFVILLISSSFVGLGQKLNGVVIDKSKIGIPGAKIKNVSSSTLAISDSDGEFEISADEKDTLIFTYSGFDTTKIVVDSEMLKAGNKLQIKLVEKVQEVVETNVIRKRMSNFDVGFLPPIKDVQIYTGTNAVIELKDLNGAKSTGNPREMFAKIPGLNIWESDGAGIQIGVGGRGLSPNRTANFNTRQNGYDISADALGYPESYYTPPFEALKSIEIIRGSAALQFGTQFGGLLNFIIRDPNPTTPFEFTTRNTAGTYGYFGTFNRITGSKGRFSYQAYHQYKRGDGYRANSSFYQHQAFAQASYYLSDRSKLRVEFTHMNYLTRQAGGLTDLAFETDPRQSVRDRNWFNVNWNLLALHFDQEIGKNGTLNFRAFGMVSERNTLGFLGKVTQADPGGLREMLAGRFKNGGAELRYLTRYRTNNSEKMKGAILLGGRFYKGNTKSEQGLATDGDDADFTYRNADNLEGSSFDYPSQNIAFFAENILFLGRRLTVNFGGRFENIYSASEGYYKQYVIHPINQDTLATYLVRDSNEVLRNVFLGGAGASYRLGRFGKVYANYTQNYRAINFTDIRINNPNVVVDSLIQDEYGYTAELGYRGVIRNFMIYDLAAFYVFYGDKIGLAPKPGTIQKERTNIGDARNMGIEFFTEIDFLKIKNDSSKYSLSWFINAAYIDAKYIRSKEPNYLDKQVEYVSPIILKSGIRFRSKKWSIQFQASYNSSQFADASNSVIPSGDAVIGEIPAYLVMDLSTHYTLNKSFRFELSVNNLTNQSYFTRRASGYPGPGILPSDGIGIYGTVQYTFKAK
jgi:Fe(3+) dicitrate transport protein